MTRAANGAVGRSWKAAAPMSGINFAAPDAPPIMPVKSDHTGELLGRSEPRPPRSWFSRYGGSHGSRRRPGTFWGGRLPTASRCAKVECQASPEGAARGRGYHDRAGYRQPVFQPRGVNKRGQCMTQGKLCSSTPWPRPIEIVRISDGQNVLETGGVRKEEAIAFAPTVPAALRGASKRNVRWQCRCCGPPRAALREGCRVLRSALVLRQASA